MLEATHSNLSIFVERTGLVGDVAVALSFECKLSPCCLIKLQCCCGCECFPQGSEEACVAYSLYLAVNAALCGDPLATSKSKVASVACGYNDGEFVISWKVKGTGSAVRKSLGIALKQLAPSKTYATYSRCVKEVGGKADREAFNAAAENVLKAIKGSVQCGVVGAIKTHKVDPATKKETVALDLKEMLSILHKKLPQDSVEGKKSPNKEHRPCSHEDKSEVKVTGCDAYFLKDYVSSKVRGVEPIICDKVLLVPLKPSMWETLSKKLKQTVGDYVEAKYAKVKNDLHTIIAYMILSKAECGVGSVAKLVKSEMKAGDVTRALTKAL